jgi:hypothetical protein
MISSEIGIISQVAHFGDILISPLSHPSIMIDEIPSIWV